MAHKALSLSARAHDTHTIFLANNAGGDFLSLRLVLSSLRGGRLKILEGFVKHVLRLQLLLLLIGLLPIRFAIRIPQVFRRCTPLLQMSTKSQQKNIFLRNRAQCER